MTLGKRLCSVGKASFPIFITISCYSVMRDEIEEKFCFVVVTPKSYLSASYRLSPVPYTRYLILDMYKVDLMFPQ